MEYGNTTIIGMHLYPRRRKVAAQVTEELKMVTYAKTPMKERRRRTRRFAGGSCHKSKCVVPVSAYAAPVSDLPRRCQRCRTNVSFAAPVSALSDQPFCQPRHMLIMLTLTQCHTYIMLNVRLFQKVFNQMPITFPVKIVRTRSI